MVPAHVSLYGVVSEFMTDIGGLNEVLPVTWILFLQILPYIGIVFVFGLVFILFAPKAWLEWYELHKKGSSDSP